MSDSDALSVFVSYARADGSGFAEEIVAGLEAAGFDPFLDRHDIAPGEDWEARLGHLLARADTVVFVLTPASVASERCRWEVDKALALSKRIIPVVAIDVPEETVHPAMRRLNFIFFSRPNSFGPGLKQLSAALRTDLDWVREHTRLGEMAAHWQAMSRDEALLLRGTQLEAARAWLELWRPGLPDPTGDHRSFVSDSEAFEARLNSEEARRLAEIERVQAERAAALRRASRSNRLLLGLAAVLLLGACSGAYVFWDQRREAVAAQASADAAIAESQRLAQEVAAQSAEIARLSQEVRQQRDVAQSAADPLEQEVGRGDTEEVTLADMPATTPARPEAPSPEEERLRQARINLGWDVDVFWCAGPGGEASQALATRMGRALEAERERQLSGPAGSVGEIGFGLGRLRVRELREEVNARPGYNVSQNEVRAEASEQEVGAQLRAFLSGEVGSRVSMRTSGTSTPYYLSVFACGTG